MQLTSNGVYELINNVWTKLSLPVNDISSIDIINNDVELKTLTQLTDVDRMWVGTNGLGVYKREKEDKTSTYISDVWERSFVNMDYNFISASNWFVRDYSDVTSLFVFDDINTSYKFDPSLYQYRKINSNIENYSNLFDWEESKTIRLPSYNNTKLFSHCSYYDYALSESNRNHPNYIIDPSNVLYLTNYSDCVSNKNSSLKYHKMTNFISGTYGYGRGEKKDINGFAIQKRTIIDGNKEVYELPFNHTPDRRLCHGY